MNIASFFKDDVAVPIHSAGILIAVAGIVLSHILALMGIYSFAISIIYASIIIMIYTIKDFFPKERWCTEICALLIISVYLIILIFF